MCYADYVVGGTSTHMVGLRSMIDSLGFLRSGSPLSRNLFWNVFFMFRGGTFGDSETGPFSTIKPLIVKLIGKNGSKFIKEELSMDNVYNYMFHLLNEYSKLLKYKPTVPPRAVELCSESMACPERGVNKAFMMESLVKEDTSDVEPCMIPQPYDPSTLDVLLKRKESYVIQLFHIPTLSHVKNGVFGLPSTRSLMRPTSPFSLTGKRPAKERVTAGTGREHVAHSHGVNYRSYDE
nr:O-glucosyltransferase rumi homolog [Tanacetum cinerariifolium]